MGEKEAMLLVLHGYYGFRRTGGRSLGNLKRNNAVADVREHSGGKIPSRFLFLCFRFGHKIRQLSNVKCQRKRSGQMQEGRWNCNIKNVLK